MAEESSQYSMKLQGNKVLPNTVLSYKRECDRQILHCECFALFWKCHDIGMLMLLNNISMNLLAISNGNMQT